MKKLFLLILLFTGCTFLPSGLRAQVTDSTSIVIASPTVSEIPYAASHPRDPKQGQTMTNIGTAVMLGGGGISALTVGFGLWSIGSMLTEGGGILAGILGGLALYGIAASTAAVAVGTAALALPFFAMGKSLEMCDEYWATSHYAGPGQRGFSVLMDAGVGIAYIQLSIIPGYHLDEHLFLGAGTTPTYVLSNNTPPVSHAPILPFYAHARYSFSDGVLSPYVSASPGYDFLGKSIYCSADIGIRMRYSKDSPVSFWASLRGTYDKNLQNAGLVLGWSF